MEALVYEKLDQQKVRCNLCHHRCRIPDGKRGICHVRENRSGRLETLVYGKLIARNIDPIEKKPIFHLAPGSLSYSVATCGCNFRCRFCQNADIAQMPSDQNGRIVGTETAPSEIVRDATENRCRTIAYTYTEPTVFFEFVLDTARLAPRQGIRNVLVTNGYMTPEALSLLSPYLDAANIDIKAYSEAFYRTWCGAALEPVKATAKAMKQAGIWVEITTLLIPGLNDDPTELAQLAGFIADELGPETPWHISRFHPTYHMLDRPVTPVESILDARKIGTKAGLRYVYSGNIHGGSGENTVCCRCGETVIARQGYRIRDYRIENKGCFNCGSLIDGIDL